MRRSHFRRRRAQRRWRMVWVAMLGICVTVVGWTQAPSSSPPVSQVVYPTQSVVKFTHSKHPQPCTQCHGAAQTSRRAIDNLRPTMEVCAKCHGKEDAPAPKISDCGGCHLGYSVTAPVKVAADWKAVRPAPMIPRPRPANLRFPHAKHIALSAQSADGSCTACHQAQKPMGMPSMQTCNTCHNGKMAPSDCATCHPTDQKTQRIRTHFGPGKSTLKPTNHTVDWVKRHGPMAKSDGMECSSCHQEIECAACHTEQLSKPYKVHMPNYIVVHSVDARADMGNCTDCHSLDTYCTSCHVRTNVTMRPKNDPPARYQFHPEGWVNASMPNNHGVMARRNIDDCASCHAENDCVTCHIGVNPHPPEFALSCRSMLASNPTPCAKCHQDLGSLQVLCR